MRNAATEAICAELDGVYAALRAGRIEGLSAMAVRLEAGLASLADPGAEALATIRHRAARNAACLAAAGRGVRAARRRIAEIRAIEAGCVTYDMHGRRDEAGASEGLLVRRL